jgi:hypothetical protein
MKQNYLNIKFISALLEDIKQAFLAQKDMIHDVTLTKWGVHDDYIYSEYLYRHFEDALPCERKAVMRIIREVINASSEGYSELIDEGYYCYEDFDNFDYSLEELTEKLSLKLKEDDD